MCICHKFVKEYFIFVVAFTQIRSKQALDESRSQFAVFAAPCTCVIPYGQNSAERTFLSYHKSLNLYRRKIELLFFFIPHPEAILLHPLLVYILKSDAASISKAGPAN